VGERRSGSATERRRVLVSTGVGVAATAVAALFCPWQASALIGFDVKATVELTWIWKHIGRLSSAETRARAASEDDGPAAFSVIVVLAPTMALAGVVAALMKERQVAPPQSGMLIVASVLTVVAAWVLVHTTYTLRYARRYYARTPAGGIEFAGDEDPDYRDFAYVAFTVGMSFAVSETPPTTHEMRRLVTWHGLLSYLFGAVIIGMVINIMAGLIG
jgi:uncharacterized membrane protein